MAVEYRETMTWPVQYRHALTRVMEPNTATPPGMRLVTNARSVVDDTDFEHQTARPSLDSHTATLLPRGDRIFERILQQRLEQKTGYQGLQGGSFDRIFQAQALTKAQPLGSEVEVERLDFLAQRHLFHRVL